MDIYVVRPGDSVYSIAKKYNVPPATIIRDNALANPEQLVVGQSLVVNPGATIYTVKPGDSLYSIARSRGLTVNQLLQANPQLPAGGMIQPGNTITIPPSGQQKLGTIEVNGYIFPGSNPAVVTPAFPSLTYLSIFSYQVSPDGSLDTIDDASWIALARNNRVAPVMVVTNIKPSGGFDSNIAHSVLTNTQARDNLIRNIENTLKTKNYYALNIDFEYIFPTDRQSYNDFLKLITGRLHSLGYPVFTAVAPKLSATQPGLLYEAHDYPAHGATVDRVILMTYEWGYLAGPPQAVAPLNQVRKVLDYAVTAIPRDKILMGMPNYGYDWTLPYVRGTLASTFSNIEAVNRAFRNKAAIRFDTLAQSPYYSYYDANGKEHIVWFEDARSIRSKLRLVNEYGLAGVSYWTIERPFPQNLVVLNSMYNVKKVI